MLFADEAGLYLLPMATRTGAPQVRTPLLEETVSRDHLSVMAAITPDGRLYSQAREEAFNGASVASFLRRLLKRIAGNITLVWDGATIHRSKEVRAFLSEGAAERLQLVALPGYAPELNPTEQAWNFLKRTEHDLTELRSLLVRAREHLRRQPRLLQSFFRPLDFY